MRTVSIITSAVFCLLLTFPTFGQGREEVRFSASKPGPYDYVEYAYLLKETVYKPGLSDRRKPSEFALGFKDFGTGKLSPLSRLPTSLEGNRVIFHLLTNDHKLALKTALNDMLTWPEERALESLSKNARLSYWLNLHNLALYALIAQQYPYTYIEHWLTGKNEGVDQYENKWLAIGGSLWSLADIKAHVYANWSDPLIFYGLWRGSVGGPNLQGDPFETNTVWDMLADGARDYVQSLRGVRFINSQTGRVRVSKLYDDLRALYGDQFEKKLLKHLRDYAEGHHAKRLEKGTYIQATFFDPHIADVLNGRLPSGVWDKKNPFPGHAGNFRAAVLQRNLKLYNKERYGGTVQVEEYVAVEDPEEETEEDPSKPD